MRHFGKTELKIENLTYEIQIENIKIGTTELEYSDAPMGTVYWKIKFENITSGYDFFKNYCSKNKIEFTDYEDEKLILTMNIPNLKVFNKNKIEISGMSTSVSGMDSDEFEITIFGISYPFFEIEFPEHVKRYNEMF